MATYRCGSSRYDRVRDPEDRQYVESVLPAEPGPVHAVAVPLHERKPLRRPVIYDSSMLYREAVCGAPVKVEYPMEFDPGSDESCQRCVGPVLRGESGLPRRRLEDNDDEP
ncbi:hypothetical protein [Blastococcus sp. KM273129]|uniref:hypothetical protein n=1 Tax=Blastococcus sp. KM273129 TaxID=2570315 RepID=UPI001F23249F|nr:hypothetical protein [Blastococcus sp. KM273129]MCF6734894.1 hypothetical protein [Blastococcus sp. KM273129]